MAANGPSSKSVAINYHIDLAELNASIAGRILNPFGRTSWSKSWLGDISKELRLMVYEAYFRRHAATVHASPNPEYAYESGETSHDLIFPDCPKSSTKSPIDEVRRSHKNLFFVCSTVKDEAHKMYLRHALFQIQADTCTMRANFLHYEPVTKLVRLINLVSDSETIPKLVKITTAFASKQKLRLILMLCSLPATAKDLPSQGAQFFANLLPRVNQFDAQYLFIVVHMPHITAESELPCCVSIAPVNSKKDPSICYGFEGTTEKKEFLEEITITAPDLACAMIVRDFIVDAMLKKDECRPSRIVIFNIFTSIVQGKQGRERKRQMETQRFDLEL